MTPTRQDRWQGGGSGNPRIRLYRSSIEEGRHALSGSRRSADCLSARARLYGGKCPVKRAIKGGNVVERSGQLV